MDDLIAEFLTETGESIGELDNSLVLLEQDPNNGELLSKIFRVMHTIKGTSGFLGLPRLGTVAHKAEDLLGLFRDGKLQATPAYVTLILEALDVIKAILAGIEATGQEPAGSDEDLIGRLKAACAGETAPESGKKAGNSEEQEPQSQANGIPPGSPALSQEQVPAPAASSSEPSLASQTLRVSVDVLEDLMTMVSELVLTRNQILQVARNHKDNTMSGSLQRLNHIVSDLQEGVMKTRMQPVGNAWAKLPRIVRDIAADLGKKIDLEMHGQETELDRQVLEMIKDPLTHMVRNSADHGIETPDLRLAAGKGEAGKIKLSSWHEGGHIIIEIADDGKGLSTDRIKKKILDNKLATADELESMSIQQIQQFIFHAGFSTAEKVTAVSGRGVGMDVVRSNIEKISGSIEMKSTEGQGTTFTIKIPLTLAIVSALIVGAGEERFAIPQLDVRELVMVSAQSANRIEMINGVPVFRLRDRLLPLIDLRDLLKLEKTAQEERPRYIAVIKVGPASFGLIVDKVFDTEEIVVKPVTSLLRQISFFSGNTILGDGQVIMILDPAGIMKTTGIINAKNLTQEQEEDMQKSDLQTSEIPLLLFQAGGRKALKAVPLKHVDRLEEIDLSKIELAGGKRVIQYLDTLMPIFLCDERELPKEGRRPVIVFATKTGMAGLLVDRILDITNFRGKFQITSEGRLAGSAIIEGQATDILNLTGEDHLPQAEETGADNDETPTAFQPHAAGQADTSYQGAMQ